MTLYMIRAACPHCFEVSRHVEETEGPAALDMDVGVSTEYCPVCGFHVANHGADEWDVREEIEIETVPATDPAEGSA